MQRIACRFGGRARDHPIVRIEIALAARNFLHRVRLRCLLLPNRVSYRRKLHGLKSRSLDAVRFQRPLASRALFFDGEHIADRCRRAVEFRFHSTAPVEGYESVSQRGVPVEIRRNLRGTHIACGRECATPEMHAMRLALL